MCSVHDLDQLRQNSCSSIKNIVSKNDYPYSEKFPRRSGVGLLILVKVKHISNILPKLGEVVYNPRKTVSIDIRTQRKTQTVSHRRACSHATRGLRDAAVKRGSLEPVLQTNYPQGRHGARRGAGQATQVTGLGERSPEV